MVLNDIISRVEQNILIKEVENNSFNIVLEQTVLSDEPNLIANTIITAPIANEKEKLEELVLETSEEN